MQGLLSDSANRQNPRIWLVLCDALKAQYEQSNERLYLKQATDTTTIFSLTMRLFETLSAFDSLDVRPDSKGRGARRAQGAPCGLPPLDPAPILFNGGVFYTRKRQYADAYRFYETYIQSQDWPIFTGYDYADRDPLLPHAAYWAMYCGYKLGSADEYAIRYQDLAERDTSTAQLRQAVSGRGLPASGGLDALCGGPSGRFRPLSQLLLLLSEADRLLRAPRRP